LVNRVENVVCARRGIFVALGGNVPWHGRSSADVLRLALGSFPDIGLQVLRVSRFWRSEPWPPGAVGAPFVNAVADVDTAMDAADVLSGLHVLEAQFGRVRRAANAPRTLDLDLIDYRGQLAAQPQLPHPRCADRAFVLAPLAEVAPHWRHPVSGIRIDRLLRRLDRAGLRPLTASGD
jgi:2-amino-4-hydroxy-6-hydroxymethyldihydropteridine diphosphokinase